MNDAAVPARLPLGQWLESRGLISADQLRIALREQTRHARPMGRVLIDLGFISEGILRDALGQSLGHASIDLDQVLPDPAALARLPERVARQHRVLPVSCSEDGRQMTVAMADIHDIVALDVMRDMLPHDATLTTLLAGEGELAQAIDRSYGHALSIEHILAELENHGPEQANRVAQDGSPPVVRLVDALLIDAVKREASDIHFEPEAGFLRIRYRIDGLLRQIRALHASCWPAMAVRIKVMAGMNIAEHRAPQDGRLSLHVSGRAIDLRVSSQPTLHGENIVLRILDRARGIVPLDSLGLSEPTRQALTLLMARPEGLILATGPTGSGKTTTLYSLLNHLNHEGVNIMALEDPVEYPMPLMRQTSVVEAARLDFANGIRSMMRQDPDIILVGEIRDADTAGMAFRAAMTGHQVYSTLHSNSALGALPRLLDLGVRQDVLAGNLIGVIAQRLLRRLCPECSQPRIAGAADMRLLGMAADTAPVVLRDAGGCPACDFTGYRGRFAVMEILRIDAGLEGLIGTGASAAELRRAAGTGLRSLADEGADAVLAGRTSLAELCRVIDMSSRLAGLHAERGAS
ncbi:GspE/PulE family protein [Methyloversatilis thermotolerans]|uniref:GspE/PulE family protein n=1 Tax=Methyloversatilis thermotolerans TaxID=1346290 RepID=UPI000366C9C8|nr:GspE/PulE family protein [Methyloversatilis thermotolerans]